MAQKIEITVYDDDFNLSEVLTALESVLGVASLPWAAPDGGRFKIEAEGYADGVYGAGDDTGWARRVGDRWVS